METLFKDIRYGFRSLIRHSGFTAIAVITLALGIGAGTGSVNLALYQGMTLVVPLNKAYEGFSP